MRLLIEEHGSYIWVNGMRYKLHHSALERGYQTVKVDSYVPYSGRFGHGFKRYTHNPMSTQYVIITYYLKEW